MPRLQKGPIQFPLNGTCLLVGGRTPEWVGYREKGGMGKRG